MPQPSKLQRRLYQQEQVAELGQQALATDEIDQLMHDACVTIAETLDTEYCKVLELLPGGDAVFLRHGVGWQDGLVGTATVPTDLDSQAGYTLVTEEPVIVDDLRSESRFSGPELLTSHDVVSGISVIIGSVEEPWGVLGAHDTDARDFTEHDANFVQSIANVLASTIKREQRERALERSHRRVQLALSATDATVWEWEFGTDLVTTHPEPHGLFETTVRSSEAFMQSIHPDDRQRVEQALEEAVETESPYHAEYRYLVDDDVRWAEDYGELYEPVGGNGKRLIGVAYDVTERREREQALRERNKELTALHRSAELFATRDDPCDVLLAELADVIPSWFQVPPETGVRIIYGDTEISSGGFDQSAETIEALTHTNQEVEVRITISRRSDAPDDRAFLPEEQVLIETLTNFLCEALERQAREQDLREYHSMTEVANDVIITIDTDSIIQRVNPAVEDIFGYDPDELTGESLTRLMPDAVADRHRDAVGRYLDTGERNTDWDYLETTGMRRDGTEIQLAISFSTFEMHGDCYFTGVIRDISEKQERQAEIIRLLDLLRQTERTANVGSWELATDTMELFWSDQLFDLVGLSDADEEPPVEKILDSVHYDDRPTVQEALTAALTEGEPIDDEVRFIMPDGTIKWLHLQGMPEKTDGDVVRIRGAAQDITDRKERERALEKSHERLEEFASAVSHDLREPLSTVASYLKLLERRYEGELDEDAEEFIDFAVGGANRMREMIDGLVSTYARLENNGDSLEPVDLGEVLGDVMLDLDRKIEEQDADITAEPLPVVTGNRGQLEQVLMNLIDNAIKYSGDEPPCIHVSSECEDEICEISVRDEGIGIEPGVTDRVFDVFTRAHTDDAYSGSGIGLALCDRIIERHGGEIWVESEPDEGSTFTFTVPLA